MRLKVSDKELVVYCDCEDPDAPEDEPRMTECEPAGAGVDNNDFTCPVCSHSVRVFIKDGEK